MTKSSEKKNSKHSVAVLVSEGLGLFEFGIAVEVFGLDRPEFDFAWYDFKVVYAENETVTATAGVQVTGQYNLDHLQQVDTIIVPSWSSQQGAQSERLIKEMRAASARGARILSICSGVFLLAAAGLLKDKSVTTHWKHLARLKTLYPDLLLEQDSLYVDHGNIICSAGSSAGIDACMHLVRRDFGAAIANDVARRLVSHPHRVGGQAQFIPKPVATRKQHTISSAMDWAVRNIAQKISVKDMAERVHMSERTFSRRFREAVGQPPMEWLQRMRIAQAQDLLESSTASHSDIAELCGYQSIETFRVAFKRVAGISVGAYRSRFQAAEAGKSKTRLSN